MKILIISSLMFFLPCFAYATSGACSDHGGVDCSAGPGENGQAICTDTWNGSSVSYFSMIECEPYFSIYQNPVQICGAEPAPPDCADLSTNVQDDMNILNSPSGSTFFPQAAITQYQT